MVIASCQHSNMMTTQLTSEELEAHNYDSGESVLDIHAGIGHSIFQPLATV